MSYTTLNIILLLTIGRHIVQELQKENNSLSQTIKLLKSENQLLVSETEQLREVGTMF